MATSRAVAEIEGREQRKFFRVEVKLPVSFAPVGGATHANRWTARTHDVTPGGLSFTTSRKLEPGDRLDIAITLYVPNLSAPPQKIRATARVVRVIEQPEEARFASARVRALRESERMRAAEIAIDERESAQLRAAERAAEEERYLVGVELCDVREIEQMVLARFLFGAQRGRAAS